MQKEYFEHKTSIMNIQFNKSKLDSIRNNETIRKTVRLFDKNHLGMSSTKSDIDFDILEKNALSSLDTGVTVNYSLPEGTEKSWNIRQLNIDQNAARDRLRELLDRLNTRFPKFNAKGRFQYTDETINLSNSLGADYRVEKNKIHLMLSLSSIDEINFNNILFSCNFTENLDVDKLIDDIAPFADAFHKKEKMIDKDIPVLIGGYTNINYAFRFLNTYLRGDIVEKEPSYFSGKTREKIFADDFTLYDCNHLPSAGICRPFDSDGYMRSNTKLPLIENGVLITPMYDLSTASQFNRMPTGNGYRAYNSSITVLRSNFLMLPESSRSIKDIDRALISCYGYGSFQKNGDISFIVKDGYIIEKGIIKAKAENLMLTSNIGDLFGKDYIGPFKERMMRDDPTSGYIGFNMHMSQ